MFVGLIMNAFVIGSMASALNVMDSKKQLCRGKLETIGLYLLVNNVSQDLRTRILEYYSYLYTSSQSFSDLHLLQDLPPSLATRLAITAHRRIVSRAPFIGALSNVALLRVLRRLQPLVYVPTQVIQVEGHELRQIRCVIHTRDLAVTSRSSQLRHRARASEPAHVSSIRQQLHARELEACQPLPPLS